MAGLRSLANRGLARATHRLRELPIVTLMAHSACNCRCVMCDIWRANAERREISDALLARHVDDLRRLGVKWVVLSGGEPLLHSNLFALCERIRALPARITLLSTGLLLERHAQEIVRHVDEVIVSLDGPPALHDAIRNVPRAYERMAAGAKRLRAIGPGLELRARCVVHARNFRQLPAIVDTAHALGCDQISFLAADLTSEAFNRPGGWSAERAGSLALTVEELAELRRVLAALRRSHADAFARGFIAESPQKLERIVHHYAAQLGLCPPEAPRCNAPWVSAVVEADGAVRPCFFHPTFGSIHDRPLAEIVNSGEMVDFRRRLDVARDPTCQRCVCSLHWSARASVPASPPRDRATAQPPS